jgi:hypothetical protein
VAVKIIFLLLIAHTAAFLELSVATLSLSLVQMEQPTYYCGIFAQSKNCGGRETAVARSWSVHTMQRNTSCTLWHHETTDQVLQEVLSVGSCHIRCYATVRWTHICSSESTRNNRGSSVLCGSALWLYKVNLMQPELELFRVLEMAVAAENWKEWAFKDDWE